MPLERKSRLEEAPYLWRRNPGNRNKRNSHPEEIAVPIEKKLCAAMKRSLCRTRSKQNIHWPRVHMSSTFRLGLSGALFRCLTLEEYSGRNELCELLWEKLRAEDSLLRHLQKEPEKCPSDGEVAVAERGLKVESNPQASTLESRVTAEKDAVIQETAEETQEVAGTQKRAPKRRGI